MMEWNYKQTTSFNCNVITSDNKRASSWCEPGNDDIIQTSSTWRYSVDDIMLFYQHPENQKSPEEVLAWISRFVPCWYEVNDDDDYYEHYNYDHHCEESILDDSERQQL